MALAHTRVSQVEFERFAAQPDNSERRLELIAGEVVEMVSNNYASQIAGRFTAFAGTFIIQHDLGYFTSADGGYRVFGEDYIPDFGFISNKRQPEPSRDTYNLLAPDFALEVVSPTDSERKLTTKVSNYLAAGTVVLVVYPDDKEAAVHAPGKPVQTLTIDDTFDGGDVLPGFKLPVRDMFPKRKDEGV